MKICVTGHRPDKLFGYNFNNDQWDYMKLVFQEILIKKGCTDAWTGMALGTDTIFALAVLELKNAGYPIKLHCAIPCKNQFSKWRKADVDRYKQILKCADSIYYVSMESYKPYLMQKRNIFMVDEVDEVFAVWDGTDGGTANCIKYAIRTGKKVTNLYEILNSE